MQCRGVRKHGGEVKLSAHVDQLLMEKGRATGVLLKSGQVIKTRKVPSASIACIDIRHPPFVTPVFCPEFAKPVSLRYVSMVFLLCRT